MSEGSPAPSTDDPAVLRRWRNAIFVIFWLTGFIFASWATRVPGVRDILDASTGQMGLLILGLAVIRGRIDAETAFRLSRVDEDFQIERWGQDDEARDAAESRRAAMLVAERLWHLSRRG